MTDTIKPALHERETPSQHDGSESEPFGPFTPDHETALGDTPEAHDEITPHDLPLGHPGRQAAEHQANDGDGDGTTRGNT